MIHRRVRGRRTLIPAVYGLAPPRAVARGGLFHLIFIARRARSSGVAVRMAGVVERVGDGLVVRVEDAGEPHPKEDENAQDHCGQRLFVRHLRQPRVGQPPLGLLVLESCAVLKAGVSA